MPAYRGGQKAWEEAAGGETCGVLCGNMLEWLGSAYSAEETFGSPGGVLSAWSADAKELT